MTIQKQEKLYEGKAKILYATTDPNVIVQYFKDDATAFNAQKKGTIVNKGIINNQISSQIFQFLEKNHIPTHFLERSNDREMVCRKLTIIPLEVVVRNVVAGSLAKRTGLAEGEPLRQSIIELYYKDDALGDPMVNDDHVAAFGWASPKDLEEIRAYARKINALLQDFFNRINIILVDFKLEFGRDPQGKIFLGDEITPDGCRLWDKDTKEKLDKDRFRRDLGGVEESYRKVLQAVMEGGF